MKTPSRSKPRRAAEERRPPPPGASLFSPLAWHAVAGRTGLSPRELEIVRAMFDGLTEPAIAASLGMSPHTVHTHLRRLFHKLNVTSRSQAILRIVEAYLDLLGIAPDGSPASGPDRPVGLS